MRQSLDLLSKIAVYDLTHHGALLSGYRDNLSGQVQNFLAQFSQDLAFITEVSDDLPAIKRKLTGHLSDVMTVDDAATLIRLHHLIEFLETSNDRDQDVIDKLKIYYQASLTALAHQFLAHDFISGLLTILALAENEKCICLNPDRIKILEEVEMCLVDAAVTEKFDAQTVNEMQAKIRLVLQALDTRKDSSVYLHFLHAIFNSDEPEIQKLCQQFHPAEVVAHFNHTNQPLPGLINVLMLARKSNLDKPELIIELDEVARQLGRWHTGCDTSSVIEQLEHIISRNDNSNKSFIRLALYILKSDLLNQKATIQSTALHSQRPRKVAFVDIDGTLIINGKLNLQLVDKLKEYDDVILFTQRSKFLQVSQLVSAISRIPITDSLPELTTTSHVLLALQAHGIHVRGVSSSVDHYFGEPLAYYQSGEMERFEADAYKVGIDLRYDRDTDQVPRLNLAVQQEFEIIKSSSQSDSARLQPSDVYPKDKVEQYQRLLQSCRVNYPYEQIDVTVFDDSETNLDEILKSPSIPLTDQPVAIHVTPDTCKPMLVALQDVDQEKYSRLTFKNLAFFIDYLLEIKKYNESLPDGKEIEFLVDTVIGRLFLIKMASEIQPALEEIMDLLNRLAQVEDLKLPRKDITPADLFDAIGGYSRPTPARMLVANIREEFAAGLDDSSFKQALKDTRTATVGEFHIARLMNPVREKLSRFYKALSSVPFDAVSRDDVAQEHILEQMYGDITLTASSLKDLKLDDSVSILISRSITDFISDNEIDVMGYFRLKAFTDVMEHKAAISDDRAMHYTALNFYLKRPGGMIDITRDKLIDDIARDRHIEADKLLRKFQYNEHALLKQELMAHLVSHYSLRDIPELVTQLFPLDNDRNQFKRDFIEYQVLHAYEIHQLQMRLTIDQQLDHDSEQLFQEKMVMFPQDHIAYQKRVNPDDGLSLELLTKSPDMDRKTNPIFDSLMKDSEEVYAKAKSKLRADCKKQVYADARMDRINAANEIAKQFILQIKELIETTTWTVGVRILGKRFGGETVVIQGQPRRLPANVAAIHAHCVAAIADQTMLTHFNEIATIGRDASEPHTFDFFGLRRRDPATQRFYDIFKGAYEEKAQIIKSLRLSSSGG